ncbi:MAG: AAA family ATPase [Candidatus Promineifilaceae bacterium]
MIPLRLELTNFLSYRKPAMLDFHAIHVACISGPNGAGKSSLLDAITWSLFGRARGRNDDDVINRLAAARGEAAEVRFTFELESQGYRVIRRKQQKKPASLDFQIAAAEAGWRSLSEGGIRDTQAAIERLLRMRYDIFINASFLLQGQADLFTTATPAQRKTILAELLGVTEWERYREAAAERRKQKELESKLIAVQLADIEAELAEEGERQAELALAQERLARLCDQLALQETLLEHAREQEAITNLQRQAVENLREMLERSQRQLDGLSASHVKAKEERSGYQPLLDGAAAICSEHEAWLRLGEELGAWQATADSYHALLAERRPHELALQKAQTRLEERHGELQRLERQVGAMRQERAGRQAAAAEAASRLKEIRARLSELSAQEAAWRDLRNSLAQLVAARTSRLEEQSRLEAEAGRIQGLVTEKADLAGRLKQLADALAQGAAELAELGQRQERLTAVKSERATRQAEQPRLDQAMKELKARIDQLKAGGEGACPLCGQALSEAHRRQALEELQRQGTEQGNRYRENMARLEALAAEAAELEKSVTRRGAREAAQRQLEERQGQAANRSGLLDHQLQEWRGAGAPRLAEITAALAEQGPLEEQQAELARIEAAQEEKGALEEQRAAQERVLAQAEARLSEIGQAMAAWEGAAETPGQQAELVRLALALDEGSYAPEARAALVALEGRLAALEYDPAAHDAARQQRAALSQAPHAFLALQNAETAVAVLEPRLMELEGQIATQQALVESAADDLAAAETELERLITGGADLSAISAEVSRLREAERAANRQVVHAQGRLEVLADQRRRLDELKERKAAAQRLVGRYRQLERAFGRDGVQALLIERALPEIEDAANELLDRLTAGRLRVGFNTQRALLSGDGKRETLDIHISDEVGERPYESYSGGEQFRVDFAIRLALSRLLARRANARLQTLVVDEGFGSQDPEGRQRLIEAIHAIQDDYERILVITHIDELRDAFPSRIDVEKGPAGSLISVV